MRSVAFEPLEARHLLAADFTISEFMADNDLLLLDGDSQSPDWIEIHNQGGQAGSLEGWYLTDRADDLTKWRFPNVAVPAGGYLVVFASGKDTDNYIDPDGNLHTNFQLDRDGEFVALVGADGTIASEYAAAGQDYPQQFENVSYGITREMTKTRLASPDDPARWLVPEDGSLGLEWTQPSFDDRGWMQGSSSIGFADAIDSLSFWLSADHLAGLSSGDPVSVWPDGSGRGHDALQPNAFQQPVWIDNVIGEKAVIRFDGIDDSLRVDSLQIQSDTTVFLVAQDVQQPDIGDSPRFLLTTNNHADRRDGNGYGLGYRDGGSPGVELMLGRGEGGTSRQTLTDRSGPSGTFEILSYWKANGLGVLRRNDEVVATDLQLDPVGGYTTGYSVGADPFVSGHEYRGDIAEILVFDRALTTNEREAVMDYLEESYFDAEPNVNPQFDLKEARLAAVVKTDVSGAMLGDDQSGKNATAYLRTEFQLNDREDVESLLLEMIYDDGFVAYLNGTEVARRNAGAGVAWDSAALTQRDASQSVIAEQIDISQHTSLLTVGTNVLAIHGLNSAATDSDFLVSAELALVDVNSSTPRYYTQPTPGFGNRLGIDNNGPAVTAVTHTPTRPAADDELVIAATIAPGLPPVDSVAMTYRVMFGAETETRMTDDGQGLDVEAGDGIFTGVIPHSEYDAGEMVRYFVSTLDQSGKSARKPEYFLPSRSAEYFGTVVLDPSLPDTKLPVLEWFVEDPLWYRKGNTNTRDYTFGSLFYADRFYDNIRARVRGGVTLQQAKPNYKLDFYSGGRYQYDPDFPSVEEINLQSLMGEIPTRTYMRNPLAYQLFRDTGHATPNSFYTHVRQNGEFYGLYAQEEQLDATFLERHGFDPEGALYKASSDAMLQTNLTAAQWNKATREHEDFSDLAAFAEGLSLAEPDARKQFVYDNVNIPQVIHYLAISLLGPNHDRITHNYYVHRDTNGTGQWSILPWDMDRWFPQGDLLTNPTARPIFYGDSDHPRWPGTPTTRFNRLNDAIFDIPETREMFVTHLKSVVEQWMDSSYLEDSVDRIAELIELDAALDNQKWRIGSLQGGVRAIKNTISTRRRQLANDPDLQLVGTNLLAVASPLSAHVPAGDDLGTDWTTLSFVEGSQGETWTAGKLAVGFDRGTAYDRLIGTDVEELMHERHKSVFVRIPFDFDGFDLGQLLLRIQYDDAFVAYLNGTEMARSDNLDPGAQSVDAPVNRSHSARNPVDFDVTTFKDQLVQGRNVLAIHGLNIEADNRDVLVQPQLIGIANTGDGSTDIRLDVFDASPESGNQDEEYLTLVNHERRAIDISGWTLRGGIRHEFQPGTVIPASGTLYLSPNVAAFFRRTSGPSGGQSLFVQGGYEGHLSSRGETVELVDLADKVVTSLITPDTSSDVQRYLRVTELHYNPRGNSESAEFIEFRNISDATTLDLNGVRVTDGPSEPFEFSDSRVTQLVPGEYVLIVNDESAFRAAYPSVDEERIAGTYAGNLRNSGETIKIEDAQNGTVLEFRYEDGRDPGEEEWPRGADGIGSSLIIRDEHGAVETWGDGSAWRASDQPGGSPGTADGQPVKADFDGDGDVDSADVDLMSAAVRIGDVAFDLNQDGVTDLADRHFMIESILATSVGDSNLDGVFDSGDLVLVFQTGEYEDQIASNSRWAEGDWDGDGDFTTSDLVAAFQSGTYMAAARSLFEDPTFERPHRRSLDEMSVDAVFSDDEDTPIETLQRPHM